MEHSFIYQNKLQCMGFNWFILKLNLLNLRWIFSRLRFVVHWQKWILIFSLEFDLFQKYLFSSDQ